MQRTDNPTNSVTLPTPAVAGTAGYFINRNVVGGVQGTIVDADIMNLIVEELCNVITDAGITLSKTTYNQLLTAINTKISNATGAVLPIVDTTALVKGSSDATKRLRFEVDGFTTATTRVITPPDRDLDLSTLVFEKILTQTASNSTQINFTLSSSYRAFRVYVENVLPVTNNVSLYLKTSTNGGSSFDSGASDYVWSSYYFNTAGSGFAGVNGTTQIQITDSISTTSNRKLSAIIDIINPSATEYFKCVFQTSIIDNGGGITGRIGQAQRQSTTAVNAIQFLLSSGNISSGTFTLEGIRA